MSYVKTIVCLANSYKPPNGRCVAGKEVGRNGFGGWIRPVSARPTAEVSYAECKYPDNSTPALLDIIDIPMSHADPRHHQTENHVIATGQWVRKGELPWQDVPKCLDQPSSLWINGGSTKAGLNDCISVAEAATVQDSLVLIEPTEFVVEVGKNPWKTLYRGRFKYNGTLYNLSITDPLIRAEFSNKPPGDYPLPDIYLCVSLTEPYEHDDRCHKLVAGIIRDPAS